MRKQLLMLCAAIGGLATPIAAQSFDVRYFGGGVATLAPGSENPVGKTLVAGNSFFWRISAQNGAFWSVATGGDFFPLMAFEVAESGTRTGNYQLSLFRNGSNVFNDAVIGSQQTDIHLGTNEISLATGLKFDRMELSYFLTGAINDDGDAIGSTIQRALPFFGAPEQNPFDKGVEYITPVTTVPEPAIGVMVFAGLVAIGVGGRIRVRARETAS